MFYIVTLIILLIYLKVVLIFKKKLIFFCYKYRKVVKKHRKRIITFYNFFCLCLAIFFVFSFSLEQEEGKEINNIHETRSLSYDEYSNNHFTIGESIISDKVCFSYYIKDEENNTWKLITKQANNLNIIFSDDEPPKVYTLITTLKFNCLWHNTVFLRIPFNFSIDSPRETIILPTGYNIINI